MICHEDFKSLWSGCFKEEVNRLVCTNKLVIRAPSQEVLEANFRLLTIKEDTYPNCQLQNSFEMPSVLPCKARLAEKRKEGLVTAQSND